MSLSVELDLDCLRAYMMESSALSLFLKPAWEILLNEVVSANGLSREKVWDFVPTVKKGDKLNGGDIIGTVQETKNIEQRILVPPNISGIVNEIKKGKFKV